MGLGTVNSLKRKFETLFDFSHDDGSCHEVTKEVHEWLDLSKCKLMSFINEKGSLDEFAFITSVRKEFKLHFLLFIEVMSHIPIEVNREDTFSLSKKLSNPTRTLDPTF
ncbi:MAG: hypothetical protein SGPRY_005406 [Prymnesium sp.]